MHMELRFQKGRKKWGLLLLSCHSLEDQDLGHYQSKGKNPDIFIFEKETTSISFLCTKHLKPSQILDKRGRSGSAGSSQHRVCAHYIAQIIQRAALQVLTSQFKMFKYFTLPFRHCSLSASPLQSLLKACLKCHLPKLLFNEDSE